MAKRIRVILVPSDTYNLCSHGCSLHKVADRLNECQTTYHFCVAVERLRSKAGKVSRTGVSFRRDRVLVQLRTDETDHVKLDEWSALRSYFVDQDIFEQTIRFVGNTLKERLPLNDADIIVAVGSEVAVTDDTANTFQSDAAADAYACLSVEADAGTFPATMGFTEMLADNNNPLPLQQTSMISLRRVNLIFPEAIYTDRPERARAFVARYIILNTVYFIGNRTFARSISHDDMTGCPNESNWGGGERESYFVDRYCDRCRSNFLKLGVAKKHDKTDARNAIDSLESMLEVPDIIDKHVRASDKVLFWVQFASIAVATNLICAMVLDVISKRLDVEEDIPSAISFLDVHIKTHYLGLLVASIAIVATVILLSIHVKRTKSLP